MRRILLPLLLAVAALFATPIVRAEPVAAEDSAHAGGDETHERVVTDGRRLEVPHHEGEVRLGEGLGRGRGGRRGSRVGREGGEVLEGRGGLGGVEVTGDASDVEGRVRYGKGKDGGRSSQRYRDFDAARDQFDSISDAQRRLREEGRGAAIESTEKSKQGFEFSLRSLLGKRGKEEVDGEEETGAVRHDARGKGKGKARRGRLYLEH